MTGVQSDRDAILNLLATHTQALDDGDLDARLGCFTSDGTYTSVNGTTASGRAELRAAFADSSVAGAGKHVLVNERIDVAGELASGSVDYVWVRRSAGEMNIAAVGRYRDQYRKTADGWRISARVLVPQG